MQKRFRLFLIHVIFTRIASDVFQFDSSNSLRIFVPRCAVWSDSLLQDTVKKIMAEDVEEMVGGLPTKGDDTREMKHAKGWWMI